MKDKKKLIELPIYQYMGLPLYAKVDADVGIEVEAEMNRYYSELHSLDSDDERVFSKCWKYKADYSLKKNGVEFISKPLYRSEVPTALTELDIELEKSTSHNFADLFYDSVRASTHIHVNMQNNTMLEFFKLLAVYYPLENLITKYCGSSREGNLFCLRFCDVDNIQSRLLEYAVGKNGINNLRTDNLRYAALNFQSLFKFGTVEFRTMRTPGDLQEISKWVNTLLDFKEKAIGVKSFVEIPYKISGMGAEHWAKEMLGEEFVSEYKYPNMEMDIMRNMRQMQIIYHKFQWLLQ